MLSEMGHSKKSIVFWLWHPDRMLWTVECHRTVNLKLPRSPPLHLMYFKISFHIDTSQSIHSWLRIKTEDRYRTDFSSVTFQWTQTPPTNIIPPRLPKTVPKQSACVHPHDGKRGVRRSQLTRFLFEASWCVSSLTCECWSQKRPGSSRWVSGTLMRDPTKRDSRSSLLWSHAQTHSLDKYPLLLYFTP